MPTNPKKSVSLLAVLVLALGACTVSKTLETADIEEQITEEVASTIDVEVTVECPEEIDAEEGATFTCDATDPEGNTFTADLVQTDDDGNVDWNLNVFSPPVIENELAPEVSEAVDTEITITCPRILASSEAGDSIDCEATDDAGGEGVLRVTSVDGEGNLDWELNP